MFVLLKSRSMELIIMLPFQKWTPHIHVFKLVKLQSISKKVQNSKLKVNLN